MSIFSERFKYLVDHSGYETQQLCDMWQCSRYQIYNWSTDRGTPDLDKFKLIKQTFDVSYEYLLGETDIERPINSDANLHPIAKEMLEAYREFLKTKYPNI
jgi:transcriptional regulator with XRE-family HTH domain